MLLLTPLLCLDVVCWLRLAALFVSAHVNTAYNALQEEAGMAAWFNGACALKEDFAHAVGSGFCSMRQSNLAQCEIESYSVAQN